ncbi:hypothetical protein EDC96DRAFT_548538 [Choanephora cucurbitarum]|nr:hypothetical protein EDC96DRAFT_548538 [Choanephora cucurbitarum]
MLCHHDFLLDERPFIDRPKNKIIILPKSRQDIGAKFNQGHGQRQQQSAQRISSMELVCRIPSAQSDNQSPKINLKVLIVMHNCDFSEVLKRQQMFFGSYVALIYFALFLFVL